MTPPDPTRDTVGRIVTYLADMKEFEMHYQHKLSMLKPIYQNVHSSKII